MTRRLFTTLALGMALLGLAAPARADGAETFGKRCATCHGKDGKGKTKMGEKLSIRDLTDAKLQSEITDEKIEKQINEGSKDDKGKEKMPGFKGKIADPEIKELVKVVRGFGGK